MFAATFAKSAVGSQWILISFVRASVPLAGAVCGKEGRPTSLTSSWEKPNGGIDGAVIEHELRRQHALSMPYRVSIFCSAIALLRPRGYFYVVALWIGA